MNDTLISVSTKSGKIVYLILSSLVLCAAAFYNKFPLVYSDTSTYLASGFELQTPADRPITYGLFLRFSSLNGFSLWLSIFIQSFFLAYFIHHFFFLIGLIKPYIGFLSVIFCVFSSGVSWFSSELIADIFTPILALCSICFLLDKNSSRKMTVFYLLVIFASSAMHMSHFIMIFLFCGFLFLLRFYKLFRIYLPVGRLVLLLTASALSFIVFASSYSKYRHVFFMAKLDESGLLKKILDDNCAAHDFKLCAYKDSLPATANDFMWDENSPLKREGGNKAVRDEYRKIISVALHEPRYLKEIIASSAKTSAQQLITFNTGDGNGPFMEGTKLYERIVKYAPGEKEHYSKSRQQQQELTIINPVNRYFSVAVILSFIIIIFLLLKYKFPSEIKFTGSCFCAFITINAVTCGSLAPLSDRFGCRVVWLIPFFTFVLLAKRWFNQFLNSINEPK